LTSGDRDDTLPLSRTQKPAGLPAVPAYTQYMHDALVIGAGPAGSLTALLLARAGLEVVLIEQHAFPRDKVCGECLSALGIEVLSRAGLCAFSCQPVILTSTLIHAMDGSSIEVTLPRPMWGLSRHVLDDHLLNSAKTAGVRVLQPARCEATLPHMVVRDLITNQIESLDARYILRADGKAPSDQSTGNFGIKTHFANVYGPTDAIDLFAVAGSYGGLAPVEGGRHNAAFSVATARLRAHRGDLDALFAEMTRENRTLARRLRDARRTSPWLASPLPRFGVRDDWPDNIIPIGNAAAAIEPIGGEGMGLALRSAEIAVDAVIEAWKRYQPIDRAHLRSQYRRLWRIRIAACRGLALAVSSKPIAEWVMPATCGCDSMANVAMALMGK
jgi:flavin-dependent dehydrogenase